MEVSWNRLGSIPFLDTWVTLKEGKFNTDLFKKPFARCQYLLPSSCHLLHQTTSIIYSLAYRLRRICSDNNTFELRLAELKQDLLSRNYNSKIIDSEIKKARAISREEALKKVTKSKNSRQVFVVPYHPGLPSVSTIVQKHWEVMTSSSKILQRCFPQKSLVAYSRPKNLKDELIRAKISTSRRSGRLKNGYKACQEGCQCCWISKSATTHSNFRTKETWKINSPINCKTRNVIYKLGCDSDKRVCKLFNYEGKTKRELRVRINEHRSAINRKTPGYLNDHFTRGHGKTPAAYLTVTGIERVLPHDDEELLTTRESLWINNYDSIQFGANTRR